MSVAVRFPHALNTFHEYYKCAVIFFCGNAQETLHSRQSYPSPSDGVDKASSSINSPSDDNGSTTSPILHQMDSQQYPVLVEHMVTLAGHQLAIISFINH